MIKNKLSKILTLNGLSIIFGLVGTLFGVLTILIDDFNYRLEVKWFLLLVFIFLSILLISFKLSYELYQELKTKKPNNSKAITYIQSNNTLIVSNNYYLDYSTMVSIYFIHNEIEIELGTGYVSNVQNKFTQVRILDIDKNFEKNHKKQLNELYNGKNDILRNLIVKSTIKYK